MNDKSYLALLAGFVTIAAIAAVLSVPGEREKVALQERDGDISAALARVNSSLSAGNRDVDLLDSAVRLHLRVGDLDAAIAVAELHAAALPNDPTAQMRLLDLLRDRGQDERYLALARRLYERWRHPHLLNDMLAVYRLRQNLDAEIRLLRYAIHIGQATAADIERLGMIEAARGDHDAAIELLRDGDGMRDGIERAARITLFELLVEHGRLDEAVRRAAKWLAARPDEPAAAQFCAVLVLTGRIDITQQVGWNDDAVAIGCIERLIGNGEPDAAVLLLDRWVSERRAAGTATIERFARAALKIDRADLALAVRSSVRAYAR